MCLAHPFLLFVFLQLFPYTNHYYWSASPSHIHTHTHTHTHTFSLCLSLSFFLWAHRVHLNLSKNRLTSLPEELGLLSSLVRLEANNNELSSLPTSFHHLRSLQVCLCMKKKLHWNDFLCVGVGQRYAIRLGVRGVMLFTLHRSFTLGATTSPSFLNLSFKCLAYSASTWAAITWRPSPLPSLTWSPYRCAFSLSTNFQPTSIYIYIYIYMYVCMYV